MNPNGIKIAICSTVIVQITLTYANIIHNCEQPLNKIWSHNQWIQLDTQLFESLLKQRKKYTAETKVIYTFPLKIKPS